MKHTSVKEILKYLLLVLFLWVKVDSKEKREFNSFLANKFESSEEIVEVLNLTSARYSARRDSSRSVRPIVTGSERDLEEDSVFLDVPLQRRDSVIIKTPDLTQCITSTPVDSLHKEEVNPNIPAPNNNNIVVGTGDEVFSSQLSLFVPPPPVHISVAMEEAEDEINIKISTLQLKMKQLTVDTAIDEDLETYQDHLKLINSGHEDVNRDVIKLKSRFKETLPQGRKESYERELERLGTEIPAYQNAIKRKMKEFREALPDELIPVNTAAL